MKEILEMKLVKLLSKMRLIQPGKPSRVGRMMRDTPKVKTILE